MIITPLLYHHNPRFHRILAMSSKHILTTSQQPCRLPRRPKLPQIIQKAGEKILLYQHLYERYSPLGPSKDFNRPVAIDELQAHVLDTVRTRAASASLTRATTIRAHPPEPAQAPRLGEVKRKKV